MHQRRPAPLAAIDFLAPANGDFVIVGVGASAGGLEAFTALLSALPADTGMAFILVPHLAPSHVSVLAEILSRATTMPVSEVDDNQFVEPNHVYVIPPGREMIIAAGALHLSPRDAHVAQRGVDFFFSSLAEDRGHQAIGVILSGTGTDGVAGLRAIKAEGGITFAQDDSAQHTGMPHSAVADGVVDLVLSPHEIAQELARIAAHPGLTAIAESAGNEAPLRRILETVRHTTGTDFTSYKTSTLHRRIMRRMVFAQAASVADYEQFLLRTPAEVDALFQDLLIGVTSFFRNPESFESLKDHAFPKMVSLDRPNEPIRIWVLGCSTGQEAYSLAIAFAEFSELTGQRHQVQVFASDVNPVAIETARRGRFPRTIAQDVTPERLRRYFSEVDGQYRVIQPIRDLCVFSHHNMVGDPPFSHIDLVSCRNVLIYLEPVLQRQVISMLHYALNPGGVLWLGSAETIGSHHELFDTDDAKHRIFSKRPVTGARPPLSMRQPRRNPPDSAGRTALPRESGDALKESDRLLLARFAPAGILVSREMEILQYRGDVSPYVSPTPGRASLSLLKMLGDDLQVAVRAAMLEAKREDTTVRKEQVQVTSREGVARDIAIEVIPVRAGGGGFLVLFEEPGAARSTRGAPARRVRAGGKTPHSSMADEVTRLSRELDETRAYLQAVIEQQEGAHEELQSAYEEVQSANEELQSVNEELETSKEEVQSSNEELSTVNDELRHSNSELRSTNDDLVNLLASTHLPVVFVGSDLRVRRYTPMAESALDLTPADLGRPIGAVKLRVGFPALEPLVVKAIDALANSEHDIQDANGRWHSLRIRPYRTLDNQVDGAVVVLVDIDAATRARRYAERIIATVRAPLLVLDRNMRIVSSNTAFYQTFHTDAEATVGCDLYALGQHAWDIPDLRHLLDQVFSTDDGVSDVLVTHEFAGIGRKALMLNARQFVPSQDEPPLILLAFEDVTERQHVEELKHRRVLELAAADVSKNEYLAMLAHELRNPLSPILTAAQIISKPEAPEALVQKARGIIERQIGSMARLIEDLLDVTHITQGNFALRTATVDLLVVLGQAVELVQSNMDEREQELSLSLPADPVLISGDAARLEQAFGNLLSNASKFTARAGHIWVNVEVSKVHGRARAVIVRIRDDGIGIAPDDQSRVFETFNQAGRSPHRAPGLGVGLAVVRRIVAAHGGLISLQSAGTDQGTEIIVSLPALDGAALEAEARPSRSRLPPTTDDLVQRILVVDDNIDAADGLAVLLRLRGHDVRIAHNGEAALDTAGAFQPQIVFMDISMPILDGYEVARRLRTGLDTKQAMLIAVTGLGRDEDRRLAQEAGFDHHVTKPLDPAILPTLLARRK